MRVLKQRESNDVEGKSEKRIIFLVKGSTSTLPFAAIYAKFMRPTLLTLRELARLKQSQKHTRPFV